jgi:hypothetical protein
VEACKIAQRDIIDKLMLEIEDDFTMTNRQEDNFMKIIECLKQDI